jgi:hypothetical protein
MLEAADVTDSFSSVLHRLSVNESLDGSFLASSSNNKLFAREWSCFNNPSLSFNICNLNFFFSLASIYVVFKAVFSVDDVLVISLIVLSWEFWES